MILDTTYFLPLVGIGIDKDLLLAIDDGRVNIRFTDIKLSLISIFELQAKAAKLGIDNETVSNGIDIIMRSFTIIPFYEPKIVKLASEIRGLLRDYIDCVIVATAITYGGELVTEDKEILEHRNLLANRYNLRLYSFNELTRHQA